MRRSNRSFEERLARKRETEAIYRDKWTAEMKYYENCNRDTERYNTLTSPQSSAISLQKYEEIKQLNKSVAQQEEEENRKVCLEYKQKQEQEIAEREERIKHQNRFAKKYDDVPTTILRDISNDVQLKENAIRRMEAEKKLYQLWRSENPYVKEHELNQRQKNLKVAWLDAQIEKQMAKEKEEEEMRKYLAEREKLLKEEEIKEKEEHELLENKKKATYEIIEKQIEELKKREELTDILKKEEAIELQKREELERIARERDEMIERKSRIEIDLFNLQHNRLKLRRRAKLVAEEIEEEQQFLERILKINEKEEHENNVRKLNLSLTMRQAIEHLKEQRELERKREQILSSVFDSEAKAYMQKQELAWAQEKKVRDNFFQEVISTLRQQIEEKVQAQIDQQKQLVQEREEMLKQVDEYQNEMLQEKEQTAQRKMEYAQNLDDMVLEKSVLKKQQLIEEELARKRELEQIKAEEEKLRAEIAKIQLENGSSDLNRYRRRKIIW